MHARTPHTALLRNLTLMVLIGIVFASGCAQRVQRGTPAAPAAAAATWNAYTSYTEKTAQQTGPYRLETSLRYNAGDDGHRVLALIWSNGASPLRLDIMAGIGATVAKIRESEDTFLAYSPTEKKAYHHYGDGKALFSFGVPVPFSVSDLAALLDGRFGNVFGTTRGPEASLVPDMGIAYTLERSRPKGTLVVSENGLPLRWTDGTEGGWTLEVTYPTDEDATAAPLPRKLTFTHGKGYTAIVLVKDRVRLQTPFTAEQLGLELPEGTTVLPLRSLGRN